MKRCRTKEGEIRLRHEGKDYMLGAEWLSLPDDLAESIRPHVNVIVEDSSSGHKSKDGESKA